MTRNIEDIYTNSSAAPAEATKVAKQHILGTQEEWGSNNQLITASPFAHLATETLILRRKAKRSGGWFTSQYQRPDELIKNIKKTVDI